MTSEQEVHAAPRYDCLKMEYLRSSDDGGLRSCRAERFGQSAAGPGQKARQTNLGSSAGSTKKDSGLTKFEVEVCATQRCHPSDRIPPAHVFSPWPPKYSCCSP
jgi:hypothetical protein